MATFQTYRDRLTGKIVAYDPNTGTEKYLGPDEYKQKVSSGVVSGSPLDYSLLAQAKTQQPSKATAGSTPSGLEGFNKLQALKEAANRIILMKQNQNKDLTEAGQYWRNIASNPAAFGTKDESIPASMQTDESYRLLSPAQQSSIRSAKENWARAGLSAVEDERKYREQLSGTALQNLTDIYSEQTRKEESDRNYNLDKWYKEQMLSKNNIDSGIGNYYLDDSGDLKPVDESKVFSLGGVNYDFGPSGPSGIYATDKKWGGLIRNMLNSVPDYEEYDGLKNTSSIYKTSFDRDIARLTPDSPLVGMGKYIGDASLKAGVSPELVFAILRHETENGKSPVLKSNNNPGGITWSTNWPASMKGSQREEGGYYVKFPTLGAGIDRTIQKVADSVTTGDNYASGGNKYNESQLRNLSIKTGYELKDLRKLSDQDLVQIERDSVKTAGEEFASTTAGTKIMALFNLEKDELVGVLRVMGDPGMTDETKKEYINQIYPAGLYDALFNIKTSLFGI